jgi:hypothetical protein
MSWQDALKIVDALHDAAIDESRQPTSACCDSSCCRPRWIHAGCQQCRELVAGHDVRVRRPAATERGKASRRVTLATTHQTARSNEPRAVSRHGVSRSGQAFLRHGGAPHGAGGSVCLTLRALWTPLCAGRVLAECRRRSSTAPRPVGCDGDWIVRRMRRRWLGLSSSTRV